MTACLCIHGFTGSPSEVEPLATFIETVKGWECAIPTLPGHGETLRLRGIDYQQWLQHAELELKALLAKHDTVYVIGFSMGGLIASYLAAHYPVKKLILLSAAAYYVNPSQLIKDVKEMTKDFLKGKITENELFIRYSNKIKSTPITATIQFRRLVQFVKPCLSTIQVPTFIAQGDRDGIVPLKSADFLYQTIKAKDKKIMYIENSKHLICYCEKKERLFNEIITFLEATPSRQ